MKFVSLLGAVVTIAAAQVGQAQDLKTGQETFHKYCEPCHAVGEGAKNKVGPELNGLDGRHSGTAAGYNYSDANKNSGIVWSEATFKDYIKDPKAKIPSTKMIFPGLPNEADRNNLWAYLAQFGADGKKK